MYEQADVPMEEAVEITVFTALHNAGVAYEDFSPEQMDVIYSVAESGGELEDLLNPEFPPEQIEQVTVTLRDDGQAEISLTMKTDEWKQMLSRIEVEGTDSGTKE